MSSHDAHDWQQYDLKTRLMGHLAGFFQGKALGKIKLVNRVLPAYPAKPQDLPCLTVAQTSFSLDGGALGMDFSDGDADDDQIDESHGVYCRKTIEIRYFATNQELREAARPWIEAAIVAAFRVLDDEGAQLPQVSGGADEVDFSETQPKELWMVSYQVSFRVPLVETHIWWEKAVTGGVDIAIGWGNDPGWDMPLVDRVKRLLGAQK